MILLIAIMTCVLCLIAVLLGMTHDQLKRLADAAEEANRLVKKI